MTTEEKYKKALEEISDHECTPCDYSDNDCKHKWTKIAFHPEGHNYQCYKCGKTRKVEEHCNHNWVETMFNPKEHKYECNKCGKTRKSPKLARIDVQKLEAKAEPGMRWLLDCLEDDDD